MNENKKIEKKNEKVNKLALFLSMKNSLLFYTATPTHIMIHFDTSITEDIRHV